MNKLAKFGMIAWTIICFLGSCSGIMNVARTSQARQLGDAEALGVGVGLFFWLMLWFFPMVVLGIIALVTRPKLAPSVSTNLVSGPSLCPHCGKYFEGTAQFCPLCGKSQNVVSRATASN